MILYFVRHGETDWNVKKKIQGKTDVPLNENGKQQAKELADMLLDRKKEGTLQVVRAYTSHSFVQHRRHRRRRSRLIFHVLRRMVCGKWIWATGKAEAGKALRRKIRKSIRTGMPTGVMSIHRMENVTMKC